MKKYLTVFIALLMLSGCLGPKTIVGSEYKLVPEGLIPVVIGFSTDGSFYSNASNAISGIYQLNGDKLNFNVSTKTNIVPHQEIVSFERAYFSSVPKVISYSLNGDTLILNTYDNQTLTFERNGRAQAK